MAHINEVKLRMKSVKETKQITNAMRLISAAKLKKAKRQLEQSSPYFEKVRSTMADILLRSGKIENKYFYVRDEKEDKKKVYIVITGDKGFAGGYNHNIIKFAEEHLKQDKEALLFIAGNVGRDYFAKNKYNVNMEFDYPVQNPSIYMAREITDIILGLFGDGVFDEIYIIYTHMFSSMKMEPKIMKLLPLELDALKEKLQIDENSSRIVDDSMEYEPDPKFVFDILVKKYVKGIIYGTFVESFTSEQSSRMTAMDNATSNANDMLKKLDLSYNRARQSKITQDITEIVGGAEALK
ncbi:ATP synthase F1 subunit gamma [Acetivibrio mesophilus]|uniref:ATP synthase gamma chain n=1 Tax=Acetivibrio mesophilus TaxID=2487273 RepID=A0A4Q0I525_9FIRM|nr:ATP synthase F1 subunit gamma [Acetivibrio mesophilus]RXE59371.1 F0F1 ATP synthase subunit gamma [Acetivibrio mesophilus]